MSKFILASNSPRRSELLSKIGYKPNLIIGANIDETPYEKELPRKYVLRIATEKAENIAKKHPGNFILSGDTIVTNQRQIIQKAFSDLEIERNLKLLSGKQHKVLSAICLIQPNNKLSSKVITSIVHFKQFTKRDIEDYLKTQEGLNKAGGYAIQGFAEAFVKYISGSYSNVMGLPLYETRNLLISAKVKTNK